MNGTEYCELWPDNPSRCQVIALLLKLFSSFSLIGCLFVIATICLFQLYKYFVQRLILFLCICAGIDSLNLLIGATTITRSMHLQCQVQAFLLQYFNCAEILWICSIAINIVMSLNHIQISRKEKWIHNIVWFCSLFMSVIPLFGMHYGNAGFWCWISRDATAMRLGVWYIPLLFVIISLLVAYVYVVVKVCHSVNLTEGSDFEIRKKQDMMLNEVKPLVAYPIIYFCFHLPMFISRIDDASHPTSPPYYPLAVVGVVFAASLGALNAIVFALYGKTLKLLTWNHIKGAFLSYRHGSAVVVTHNYSVLDGRDVPLLSSDEDKMECGSKSL